MPNLQAINQPTQKIIAKIFLPKKSFDQTPQKYFKVIFPSLDMRTIPRGLQDNPKTILKRMHCFGSAGEHICTISFLKL